MPSVLNPMADLYHSQLEASRRFADVLFSGTERIDHVVLEATHRAFTANLNLAHAAVSMRDPKELANIQSSLLSQRPDTAANFQKEIVRVFAEIQNELGKSMKEYIEKFGTNVARSATAPLKTAQDKATEAVFNPMTGMFSMWESAFREAATMANKNFSTVRTVAEEVSHATAQANHSVVDHFQEHVTQQANSVAEAVHVVTAQNAEHPEGEPIHPQTSQQAQDEDDAIERQNVDGYQRSGVSNGNGNGDASGTPHVEAPGSAKRSSHAAAGRRK